MRGEIQKTIFLLLLTLLASCNQAEQERVEYDQNLVGNLQADLGLSYDAGSISLSQKIEIIYVIRNTGQLSIQNLETEGFEETSPFQFKGGDYPGDGGSCSTTLESGKSCKLVIEFASSAEGSFRVPLTLHFKDGIEPTKKVIDFIGRAANVGQIDVNPATANLGVQEPNDVKTLSLNIKNIGGLDVTDINLSLASGISFSVLSSSCPSSLKANQACSVTIKFTDSATGVKQDALEIDYDNGETPISSQVPLSGIVASIEALLKFNEAFEEYEYDYSTVGAEEIYDFTISNVGYIAGTLQSISVSAPFHIVESCMDTSGPTLPVSGACNIKVAFRPTSKGTFSDSILIDYHSGKQVRSIGMPIKGFARLPAILEFSEVTSYNFGVVGINDTVKKTLLLVNQGESSAVSNAGINYPAAPFNNTYTTCPVPLNLLPKAYCLFVIEFSPASLGTVNGPLTLDYHNGLVDQSLSLLLEGEGSSLGVLSYTDSDRVYFGEPFVGEVSATKTFTISNIGTAQMDSIAMIFSEPFRFAGGGAFPGAGGTCTTSLAASSSCTIVLDAIPTTKSQALSSLIIEYFDGDSTKQATLADLSLTGKLPGSLGLYRGADGEYTSDSQISNNPLTLKNFPNGIVFTENIFIGNSGSVDTTITNLTIDFLEGGTNPFVITNNCTPGTIVSAGSGCLISIQFNSATSSDYTLRFSGDYDNGAGSSAIITSQDIVFKGRSLAFLEYSPSPGFFLSGARGGLVQDSRTITNNGSEPATNLTVAPAATLSSTHFTISDDCPATLGIGASCTVSVDFHPQIAGAWGDEFISVIYENGDIEDDPVVSDSIEVEAESFNVALLKFGGLSTPGEYDFGDVNVGDTNNKTITLFNSGGFTASSITCTVFSSPFSKTACPVTSAAGLTSNIVLTFTPTTGDLGAASSQTLEINYFDGVNNQLLSLEISGQAVPPDSQNTGWENIFAMGPSAFGMSDAWVSFEWSDFTVDNSGTVQDYFVFRKVGADSDYDFDNPIASGIATSAKTFTDTGLQPGQVYYYLVAPRVMGFRSAVDESSFSEARIITPPANMSLVHRWMANKYVCSEVLSKPTNKYNNYSCSASGPGSTNNLFDLGYDLFVDVYEMGIDGENGSGKMPKVNLGQDTAWDLCQQKSISFNGLSISVKKRLLSRKEYLIAAAWDSSLSDTDIQALENDVQSGTGCNNNGTVEAGGSNPDCVSRFYLQDAAGNAWEWTYDRMFDATDAPAARLVSSQTDWENINLVAFNNEGNKLSTYTCYAPLLGIPLPDSSGNCGTGELKVADLGSGYFHNDNFYAPAPGFGMMIVGGSSTNNSEAESGVLTSAWVSNSFQAGARCAFEVE